MSYFETHVKNKCTASALMPLSYLFNPHSFHWSNNDNNNKKTLLIKIQYCSNQEWFTRLDWWTHDHLTCSKLSAMLFRSRPWMKACLCANDNTVQKQLGQSWSQTNIHTEHREHRSENKVEYIEHNYLHISNVLMTHKSVSFLLNIYSFPVICQEKWAKRGSQIKMKT